MRKVEEERGGGGGGGWDHPARRGAPVPPGLAAGRSRILQSWALNELSLAGSHRYDLHLNKAFLCRAPGLATKVDEPGTVKCSQLHLPIWIPKPSFLKGRSHITSMLCKAMLRST